MTTVTKSQFTQTFKHGIDVNSDAVKTALANIPDAFAKLQALAGSDGIIAANKVGDAFKVVDSYDKNGSAQSFKAEGTAGTIFSALEQGKVSGPYFGRAISDAAKDRAAKDKEGYAYGNAPTSPYKNLSGNKKPGTTRPSWLANNNKCNQFVGDALTQAGVKMPTYRMTDGTEHYVNAEKLPEQKKHFDRITSEADIKVGDVVVVDYPSVGESTAHTEVVTGTGEGGLMTTGAHGDGAYEKNWSDLLQGATLNKDGGFWEKNGNKIYILRPKQLLNQPAAQPIRG